MTAKEQLKQKFKEYLCIAERPCRDCKPNNCGKNNLNLPVVFCADKIFFGYKMHNKLRHCDEIVLCDTASRNMGIYCIEHKGGNPKNFDLEHIRDQLQGGADIVCSHMLSDEKVEFSPVLVSKRGEVVPSLPSIAPTVVFKGAEYRIEDVKIGEELKPL